MGSLYMDALMGMACIYNIMEYGSTPYVGLTRNK